MTAEETEGRFVYSIGDHAWDIATFFLLQINGFFDNYFPNLTEWP